MNIRTIESHYEYRMKQVLETLAEDYRSLQEDEESPQTFDDWLWENAENFGKAVFEDMTMYCGEELTDPHNV